MNWADIYEGYCDHSEKDHTILKQMRNAYQSAQHFLQPAPSMPMSWLDNRTEIAPIARLGHNAQKQIKQQLGLAEHAKLIIVGLGGIPTKLPIDDWPIMDNHYWLIPDSWQTHHPHAISFSQTDHSFIDLLASSDLLISKPGYGSFTEAACNGIPVIYLPRHDWPEEPFLIAWLQRHGKGRAISREQLYSGSFCEIIDEMSGAATRETPTPGGAWQAAEIIAKRL